MNRDSTRLDNQPARPARSLGSPNPIPALWDSTQSLTLVGVVKQRGDVVWGQGMNMNGSYNSQVAGTPRFLPSGCPKTNPGSLGSAVMHNHASLMQSAGSSPPRGPWRT